LQQVAVDWSDLQLFVAVVRSGSVRGAARALRIDPSTVSRRVGALEQTVGTRLFERTPEGLLLTPAGKQMLESGERVDGEIADLGRRIAGHDRRVAGIVRVTFPGSLACVAHRAAAALAGVHPDLEIEMSSADAMVSLDGRQADVALRAADRPPEHLVGRRAASLASALYASGDYLARHPEPLESAAHLWVDWDRRLSGKPAIAWVGQRFPARHVAVRGLSTADVHEAVRAGAGVGPLPCVTADGDPTLVRLLDAPRPVWASIWLLTHRELRQAARVRAVIDALAAAVREARARLEGQPPQEARAMPSQKARSSSIVRTRLAGGRPARSARP
jgi:DNA-binding transcriptional LysR family regulator